MKRKPALFRKKFSPVVEVVRVQPELESGAIRAIGKTVHKREASLGFGSPGEILSIRVDEGDQISRGQLIATLRRINVGADAAEADLVRENARANYERLKLLHESGAVSDVQLDEARLALERSRQNLSITAPSEGVVLRRAVERGQVISAGQPVVVIGETIGGIIARVSLSVEQTNRIEQGDMVRVLIKDREERKGSVSQISPISSNTGLFPVEIEVPDQQGLRSGEVVEVSILTEGEGTSDIVSYDQPAAQTIVPAIALVDARADQGVVFVVDYDGIAHSRAVQTGGVKREGVVIIEGLRVGERIVTRGASLLRDGVEVTVSAE